MAELISAGTVVLGGRVCRPGWLRVSGGRITGCGPGAAPGPVTVDFPNHVAVPGFVDMHVHGGGGVSYPDDPERAAAFHRRHGTTSTLASVVSAGPDALLAAVRSLAEATRTGVVAGIHLEGPWLSHDYCGAHDPAQLRDPDRREIDALLTAGAGAITMVTLAPERPGALAAIERFADAGVVVAVGHTAAGYQQVRAAVDAGARVGTHLFNAMPGLHHREPGPVLALLEDPRVTVELIADGIHVHPAVLRHAIGVAGADRVALVTDAMAAAGADDGAFRLGGVDVDVVAGVARVRGTPTIAGSTATMDRLFRTAVGTLGPDTDDALTAAVRMTSTTPARALGLGDVGDLRAGCHASLVVLNRELRVTRVMDRGRWMGGG